MSTLGKVRRLVVTLVRYVTLRVVILSLVLLYLTFFPLRLVLTFTSLTWGTKGS